MRLNFVILLPPSEGKAEGGSARAKWSPGAGVFGKALGTQRREVAEALAKAGGGSPALLGVSGKHLERARTANRGLIGAPTLPAAERYTGVVWDHLDLTSLSTVQRERALQRIIIPSGLLGVCLASDPVPDYRLKMGARFAPFGGTMAKWWRDAVSDAINAYAKGCVVIDLLPTEHRASYVPDRTLVAAHVVVDLVTPQGKAGGHDAKAAKGLLARHLLTKTPAMKNVDDVLSATESFSDRRFKVVTKVN